MKKILIALSALLMLTAGAESFAAEHKGTYELGGALAYGTGPDVFDSGFGVSFGAGYMLKDLSPNLQARLDLSYFTFDRTVLNTTVDYSRIPLAFGARYFFPAGQALNLFAEAAVEASFDDAEFVDLFGIKHSRTDTNWGFTPGFGAEYFVKQDVSLFALGRFHIVTDNYFSAHFGAAYHF